jgi:hypothetical protein
VECRGERTTRVCMQTSLGHQTLEAPVVLYKREATFQSFQLLSHCPVRSVSSKWCFRLRCVCNCPKCIRLSILQFGNAISCRQGKSVCFWRRQTRRSMQTSFYIRQTVKCGSRGRASSLYIKLFNEIGQLRMERDQGLFAI